VEAESPNSPTKVSLLRRLSNFLLEVNPEPNTIPLQSRVSIIALYVVALLSAVAIPYNLQIDWRAGSAIAVVGELLFSGFVLGGVVSFWVTRRMQLARIFYFLAVAMICLQLIIDAGGQWGLGALYIVSGYSVIFFVLGLRGGVLIPLILLLGTLLRMPFGNFHSLSIFNSPDISSRYLTILAVATFLGIAAVCYQHVLLRGLAKVAYVDPVTGLANRARIEEHLAAKVAQAKTHRLGLGLVALKLRKFSQVTSTQGSGRADRILQKVGRRLQQFQPTGNLVGRYSGTLFVLSSPDNHPVQLEQLAIYLHSLVTGQPYDLDNDLDDQPPSGNLVSLSCEVAVSRFPQDGETEQALFANLITTLYHSQGIPGQVLFFNPAQREADHQRFRLGEELRDAIQLREFSLVYHAKLNLATGRGLGAEVLLRWHSARSGTIGPDVFIPLAEQTGQIRKITDFVIAQAFREIATLNPSLIHAINLSPLDLADRNLLPYIDQQLAETGIEAHQIEFEITEGVLMGHDPQVEEALEHLRRRGFRLAIDDFGTGYSSLSSLSSLKVNNLKIDQSFIRPLEDTKLAGNTTKHRIVETIITMGHSLGLEVTAEGVETQAQADYLKRIGCTYAQGWLYSKPVPLASYQNWLAENLG